MTRSTHCRDDGRREPCAAPRVFGSGRAHESRRYAVLLLAASFGAHGAQITVDTKTDSVLVDGKVSLREALLSVAAKADVNADVTAVRSSLYGGANLVRMAIGNGAQSIVLGAALPPIAAGTHLDGSTQPGYVDQNLITIDGSQAGAGTDGLVLYEGSAATALDIVKFGGNGLRSKGDSIFAHGFDSAAPVDPVLPDSFVAAAITQCAALDNGAAGLRVDAGSSVAATGLRVARNHGPGVLARGALAAAPLVAMSNAGDGVLVDSADRVDLQQVDIEFNGQHPDLPPADRAGIRVLRASKPDVLDGGLIVSLGGFRVHGSGTVAHQTGDGIVIGDATAQTGVVQASIGDLQIHHNGTAAEIRPLPDSAGTGIHVVQRDDAAHRTAIGILSNNIYQNAGAGIYLGTSHMYPTYTPERRVIASNDVHHNAVVPEDQCSAATATQTASQIVVDGPVAANAEESAACQPAGVDTLNECNQLSNPEGPLSNGVNNHCIWTGTQCQVAWDIGGTEGSASCFSPTNRIFAYVNNPVLTPFTQKGLAAINGAYVRARSNIWGAGGAFNATYTGSSPESGIDNGADCGIVSICP